MQRAIDLALTAAGHTAPNPLVGAVIVKDGRIIGEGCHKQYGDLHAERSALAACTEDPAGADLYVTLEPCCHHGKQPPCTEAIIQAGIGRVIVGSRDPNPLVHGKGNALLQQAGIETITDFQRAACDAINPVFFHFITTGKPYVVLKYAMTLDGKIATVKGLSQWITGEEARAKVHQDRGRLTAIMAGVGTVLADDPLLTCRAPGGRNPIRIIVDSHLRTPLKSQLMATAGDVPTILATTTKDLHRQKPYRACGAQVLVTEPDEAGHVSLPALMSQLAEQNIDSILLEGGGALSWSALSAGIVTRVQTYVAPKIFGGQTATTPVGGPGVDAPDQAFCLETQSVTPVGPDLLIESKVILCSQD